MPAIFQNIQCKGQQNCLETAHRVTYLNDVVEGFNSKNVRVTFRYPQLLSANLRLGRNKAISMLANSTHYFQE